MNFKQRLLNLNPLAVFYYFSITVLVVRGFITLLVAHNHTPAVFLFGLHMHHFVWGFLFLLISLWYLMEEWAPRWFLEIIFGISLGLIFDEFAFWAFLSFDYWSASNLVGLLALSIAAGAISFLNPAPYKIKVRKSRLYNLENLKPSPYYSFKRHFVLPCASFMCLLLILFFLK